VATGLVALVVTEQALVDAERLSVVFGPLGLALSAGAGAALMVGWLRPAPWLLALLLVAILSTIWVFAVSRFLRRSRRLGRQEQVAVEAEEGLRAQHAQVCRPGVDLLGGQPLAADDEPGGDL
jgi:membrane protein implicated in regulation of membrane protease activity